MNRHLEREVQRVVSVDSLRKAGLGESLPRGSKTICLAYKKEEYEKQMEDKACFRNCLDDQFKNHPELFPVAMSKGYDLYGFTKESVKLHIRLRRIRIKGEKAPLSIRPSFVMPYMTAFTDEVEDALFLQGFGVPYWGLTRVFGHDDMFWYRQVTAFGRNSIVGTTVKDPAKLPKDLVADEKHGHLSGEKVYAAITAGDGCVLGAALCNGAGVEELTDGYGIFAAEAQNISPGYQAETVGTDGWSATRSAWLILFQGITLILCFLHGYIKIRDRCRRGGQRAYDLGTRIWNIYHAPTKGTFAQRMRRLKEWVSKQPICATALEKIMALCNNSRQYQKAYDYPDAHRTSNLVDRLIRGLERYLFNMQHFHGDFISAELGLRAWAIQRNFRPCCPRSATTGGKDELICPAGKLNGFIYSGNWLENMLVSASMGGYQQ